MSVPLDPYHGLMHYPFPLRPDQMAFLYLPAPLTREDVERLVAFLHTLATDVEPSEPR